MAKKCLVEKIKREPRFKVENIHVVSFVVDVGGYMRRFKLCRICFRELASRGEIPGVVKASW